MEWQPIETAPKDGTEILVFSAGPENWPVDRILIARWHRRAFRAENCDFPSWGKAPPKNAYRDRDADHYFTPSLIYLTHWMPLPTAPRKMEDTGK